MKFLQILSASLAVVAATAPVLAQCDSSIATLVAPNNQFSGNSQVMFDLQVTNPAGITVTLIESVPASGVGVAFSIDVYTCPTTYLGNEGNAAAWTLVSSGSGVSNGNSALASLDVTDFSLTPGSYGMALNVTTGGFRYTNGTGSNQNYSNADLSLSLGASRSVWWGGSLFSPRVWNGALHYTCGAGGGPPVVYCTAGTSTNGCAATLSATAQPSASLSTACVITAANVEGAKAGLLFYGIDNTGFTPLPWSTTSTSFFCVKAPTQRSFQQNSGGTAGLCDGQLVLDWNVFQNAFPGALGTPFSAGDKVYVQAWYRDPPAPRTTNLSDALELTMTP